MATLLRWRTLKHLTKTLIFMQHVTSFKKKYLRAPGNCLFEPYIYDAYREGSGRLSKLVMCLWILLFSKHRSVTLFCKWRGLSVVTKLVTQKRRVKFMMSFYICCIFFYLLTIMNLSMLFVKYSLWSFRSFLLEKFRCP